MPKPLRDALGLDGGLGTRHLPLRRRPQLIPAGRTARLVDEGGRLVATGDTSIDDDVVFGLIDSGRR